MYLGLHGSLSVVSKAAVWVYKWCSHSLPRGTCEIQDGASKYFILRNYISRQLQFQLCWALPTVYRASNNSIFFFGGGGIFHLPDFKRNIIICLDEGCSSFPKSSFDFTYRHLASSI